MAGTRAPVSSDKVPIVALLAEFDGPISAVAGRVIPMGATRSGIAGIDGTRVGIVAVDSGSPAGSPAALVILGALIQVIAGTAVVRVPAEPVRGIACVVGAGISVRTFAVVAATRTGGNGGELASRIRITAVASAGIVIPAFLVRSGGAISSLAPVSQGALVTVIAGRVVGFQMTVAASRSVASVRMIAVRVIVTAAGATRRIKFTFGVATVSVDVVAIVALFPDIQGAVSTGSPRSALGISGGIPWEIVVDRRNECVAPLVDRRNGINVPYGDAVKG